MQKINTLEEVTTPDMTPDEVELMMNVTETARNNINRGYTELKKLSFEYDQLIIAKKYNEAEAIMGKLAVMSIAMSSWREICPHLDEFESPYEAVMAGVCVVEKKLIMASEVTSEKT